MATFLDVTGLEQFSNFFVFIFVWLTVYALLTYSKVIQNHAINIILGLIVGFFVLLSPIVSASIRYMAPWFAVFLILIMIVTVLIKSFGAGDLSSIAHLRVIVIVIIVGGFLLGFAAFLREQTPLPGENGTEMDYSNTVHVLFHPKILGMIFLLIVSVFTIALLAGKTS